MKTRFIVLIVVVVALIIVRLALPSIAKNQINKQLNAIEGYHASIQDVGIRLYRGAFQIHGLRIVEESSADTSIAMVWLPMLDFSIEWRALFKGRIVGEVFMDSPELNLAKPTAAEEENVSDYRIAFFEEVQQMNPIEINTFDVVNGSVAYRDPTSDPEVNISLDNIYINAINLGNVVDPDQALPASVEMHANAMGTGSMHISAALNLLKATPDMDLNLKIEALEITAFNDFIDARTNLKVERGLLYCYSEMITVDGQIEGYVKPIIEDLTIQRDSSQNFAEKVYSAVVQGATNILENPKKDQVATRVELSGTIDQTETRPVQAALNLLRNAFIEAYARELEYVVNFGGSQNTR